MLPNALSTDRTSLVEGGERLVVVTELEIGKDGAVASRHLSRPRRQPRQARLRVGRRLARRTRTEPDKIAADDGLEAQLWLQDRAAGLLKRLREQASVLDLDTVAVTPVAKDGVIESLRVSRKNRARDLIEDFMIAANGAVARFLAAAGQSAIRRVVREPRRWDRIADIAASSGIRLPAAPDGKALSAFLAARRAANPLRFPDLSLSVVELLGPGRYILDPPGPADNIGHFGLSAPDYTHATAPNRRYADLVTQRLVKAAIAGAPAPYSDVELDTIAKHCASARTPPRRSSASRASRPPRYCSSAALAPPSTPSSPASSATPPTALLSPPAEGRVVRGESGMDVGERVRVRLVRTDAERGHIVSKASDAVGDARCRGFGTQIAVVAMSEGVAGLADDPDLSPDKEREMTSVQTGVAVAAPDSAAIKQRQQATWASGDFGIVGTTLQIVGETLCEAADLRSGSKVLDVARAMATPLAAARRWCDVTSTGRAGPARGRPPPRLRRAAENRVPPGRRRGAALRRRRLRRGAVVVRRDVRAGTRACASEMLRVVRSGGTIALANWTPAGFVGRMFGVVGRHVPPRPASAGGPLGPAGAPRDAVQHRRRADPNEAARVMVRYLSAAHFIDVFRTWYGPVHKAFAALPAKGQDQLDADLHELIAEFNEGGDGTMVVPGEYLEVVVTKD